MSELIRPERTPSHPNTALHMSALAYFLTFSSYGTHLPGSEKGWVTAQHNAYGSPALPSNPSRKAYWQTHLHESPLVLDHEAREIILNALIAVCSHRQWTAHALHIRTTHVHAVISGQAPPERMLSDFKSYATRALRRALGPGERHQYWTRHGSTRYLWNEVSLRAAIDYVLNGQGEKLAYHSC